MFTTRKKEKAPEVKPADPRQQERTSGPSFASASKEISNARSAQSGASAKISTLNPHLSFEGNLKFSGTVQVDCQFRGSIETDDKLVIGTSARVDAEITAGVVEVSGKINGNIKALKSIRILSGGEVRGNIETPTIAMEEGVLFEGNCTRSSGTGSSAAETPRTAERAANAAAASSQGASSYTGAGPSLLRRSVESRTVTTT